MNRLCAHLLTRLYPRRWRERYGSEFQALLETEERRARMEVMAVADIAFAALRERLYPMRGGRPVDPTVRSLGTVLKQPSAFLPMAMSLAALALVLGSVAMDGGKTGGDEGAVAHLWQLLMAGQLPIIFYFAVKWLRLAPRQTWPVIALQAGAALASCAPVFFLNL